jgi:hypothetical protein
MFSSLIEGLRLDIRAIKDVVELHEYSRELFYSKKPQTQAEPVTEDPWQTIRARDPGRSAWQVYDHSAALLRLYAVYSVFLEELVKDYLTVLPELYETYDQLPEPVLKQHRTGFAQIMLRIGDAGPYRHLKESEIVLQLSKGISGERPYTLVKDAFFIDRQNYRSDALARLIGNLAVENVCARLAKHPSMKGFLSEKIGNATTFESELNNFVKLRNEAAHTPVEEIIASNQFLTMADFVLLTCEILTEILSREVLICAASRRQGTQIGIVDHTYRAGRVAILKMAPATVKVGDDIALVRADKVRVAKVISIQVNDVSQTSFTAVEGEEVGLGLDQKCRVGEVLRRVDLKPEPATQQQPLFGVDELAGSSVISTPLDNLELSEVLPDVEVDENFADDGP